MNQQAGSSVGMASAARPVPPGQRSAGMSTLMRYVDFGLLCGLFMAIVAVFPASLVNITRFGFMFALIGRAIMVYRWQFLAMFLKWWMFFPLLVLTALSCLWAPSKGDALKYVFIEVIFFACMVYVTRKYEWRDILLAMLITLGLAAVLSVIHPNTKTVYADAQEADLGIFSQKNVLGKRMMVLAVVALAAIILPGFKLWQRALGGAALLLGLLLVVKSNSTTALVLTAAGLGLVIAVNVVWQGLIRVRGARGLLVAMIACLVCVGGMAVGLSSSASVYDDILAKLGKSPNLTGRTVLWGYGLDYIAQHPVLGAGIEGFWRPNSSDALQIANRFQGDEGDYQFNFQNIFIELGVHLGIPGLLAITLFLIGGYGMVIWDFFKHQDHRAGIFLILATLVLGRCFTESDLYRPLEFNVSVLWIAIGMAINRASGQPRAKRQATRRAEPAIPVYRQAPPSL